MVYTHIYVDKYVCLLLLATHTRSRFVSIPGQCSTTATSKHALHAPNSCAALTNDYFVLCMPTYLYKYIFIYEYLYVHSSLRLVRIQYYTLMPFIQIYILTIFKLGIVMDFFPN